MSGNSAAPADVSAPQKVELRRDDGTLVKRVARGDAEQLVALTWAEWVGSGRRRYARLTSSAPPSSRASWSGRDGTQRIKADGSCQRAAGQFIGDPRIRREFRPLS